MSIDWRKSVCWWRGPRSSTITLAPWPAARYSSASRYAEIEPPKPEPTMQTSTRSAITAGCPSSVRSRESFRPYEYSA